MAWQLTNRSAHHHLLHPQVRVPLRDLPSAVPWKTHLAFQCCNIQWNLIHPATTFNRQVDSISAHAGSFWSEVDTPSFVHQLGHGEQWFCHVHCCVRYWNLQFPMSRSEYTLRGRARVAHWPSCREDPLSSRWIVPSSYTSQLASMKWLLQSPLLPTRPPQIPGSCHGQWRWALTPMRDLHSEIDVAFNLLDHSHHCPQVFLPGKEQSS